jgi:hypothetical protein
MQINKLYGVGNVAHLMLNDANYTIGATPMVMPELVVGLELEMEGYPEGDLETNDLFTVEQDGSLRNGGIEAITRPTKAKFVECLLGSFFADNQTTEANYSDRCSTHVHVNMQDMTLDQVRSIALVYQTVERLLFEAFIGEARENNIYCVPWYQAGFTTASMDKLIANFDLNIRTWVKYTALNMLPLRERGTIEFRHLRGTCDVAEIIKWINLISCIVKYGSTVPYDEIATSIKGMNTDSTYEGFLRAVFGEHADVFAALPNYQETLAYGVVDSKMMLLQIGKKQAVKAAEEEVPNFNWAQARQALQAYEARGRPAPAADDVFLVIPTVDNPGDGQIWTQQMRDIAAAYMRAYPTHDIGRAITYARTVYAAPDPADAALMPEPAPAREINYVAPRPDRIGPAIDQAAARLANARPAPRPARRR